MTALLTATFLFLAGLAAGAVVVSATIRLAHGRWAGPLLPAAERGAALLGPAAVLLGLATLAAGLPGATAAGATWLAVRQVAAALLALGLPARYVARVRAGGPGSHRGAAAAAVAGFVAGVSLWTAALVLEPAPWPPFAAIPAAEALGAFVSGLAFTACAGEAAGVATAATRRDLARLLFGFLLLWAYLGVSIALPIWYGAVPEEVAFLLALGSGAAAPWSAAALVAWALAALLVFPRSGVGRRPLLAAAALALAARLLQVVVLVLPAGAAARDAGLLAAAGASATLAALVLARIRGATARAPIPRPPPAAPLAGPDAPRSESPSLGG